MRKNILFSFLIIATAAAMVIGGTTAFFSDTETSEGNVFTAGAIDLKVDHTSITYNGENCEENCVENTGINLVDNGGFEVPEVTHNKKWDIFPSGSTGLFWTVEWESTQTTYNNESRPAPALVEYHEGVVAGWNAYEGDQYAELDTDWDGPDGNLTGEPALVKIYQNIPTVSGQKYKIHYAYSPRPDVTNAADNELKVRIDGLEVASHSQSGNGASTSWTSYDYMFTASGPLTKVEFAAGGTANSLGVFLDDIKVHPVECTYEFNGDICNLWEEKDLGEGDIFFNFQDVKPGDFGKNVISLHVYDNDAYACMYTENNQDDDNGLTDPEEEASDSTGGDDEGELSQYLDTFVWNDLNNDGLYQPPTETPLAGVDSFFDIFIDGNGIAYADSGNEQVLNATSTEYIGFAWCAGTLAVDEQSGDMDCDPEGMGNITQTDSLTSDVVFYAEQVRNNGDFTCDGLFGQGGGDGPTMDSITDNGPLPAFDSFFDITYRLEHQGSNQGQLIALLNGNPIGNSASAQIDSFFDIFYEIDVNPSTGQLNVKAGDAPGNIDSFFDIYITDPLINDTEGDIGIEGRALEGTPTGTDHEVEIELVQLSLHGSGPVDVLPPVGPLPVQLFGDPDFQHLRLTNPQNGSTAEGFTAIGEGHLVPGDNFNVDSFFDITYRIESQP